MEVRHNKKAWSCRRPRQAGRSLVCLLIACGALVASLTFFAPPAQGGMLVNARCPCGYHTERIPIFGGRANFKTVCLFPALCEDKGTIELVNLLDLSRRPKTCPTGRYLPYTDPLLAPSQAATLLEWRLPDGTVLRLLEGNYLCPRCRNKTLRFSRAGFWD